MTNRELKQQLQTAFVNASPKSLPEDVVAACVPSEETEEPRRGSVIPWRPMVAVAAVLALIVTGAAMLSRQTPPAVSMTVSLDVNPSIALEVDDSETVVAVNTLNEDGTIVLGEREWTGAAVETAVGTLVELMVQNGYLNDEANSILISIDGKDESRITALEQKLTTKAQAHLTGFEGAVLSQTLTADEALAQKAAQYGISRGKAMLIERIIETDPLKHFEDLVNLPINDLNLICRTAQMPKVHANGNASDKAYIGATAAIEIALADAGVTDAQAVTAECELDCEDGVMCYEVEFVYNGIEYEYEIQAMSGVVLGVGNEAAEDRDDGNFTTKPSGSENKTTSTQSSVAIGHPTSSTVTRRYLSEQQVKEIVLAHANVAPTAVEDYEVALERENGTAVYEIEFRCGNTEYEYRVDAVTGDVLSLEKEKPSVTRVTSATTTVRRTVTTRSTSRATATTTKRTETTVTTSRATTTTTKRTEITTTSEPLTTHTTTGKHPQDSPLSKEQVKGIVLSHAGIDEADVRDYECEFNRQNGKTVYQIEFRCGNTEYEYRVDAVTGDVLFADREIERD